MSRDRVARVWSLVNAEPPRVDADGRAESWLQRLCCAVARALAARGAGVTVQTADGALGVAAASDPTSAALEETQFALGVGPCVDAFAWRRPVLAPRLAAVDERRWPGYATPALDRGVAAVFAFPLQVGAARLGVLVIYRPRPGSLSPDELALALDFGAVAVQRLLDARTDPAGGQQSGALSGALDNRMEVYQAQGMPGVAADRLATVFVEVADTLIDEFDVVDFLHMVTCRTVELADVAAAGLVLADHHGDLQFVAASDERTELLELFQLQGHAHDPAARGAGPAAAGCPEQPGRHRAGQGRHRADPRRQHRRCVRAAA